MSSLNDLADSEYSADHGITVLAFEDLPKIKAVCTQYGWDNDLREICSYLEKEAKTDSISGCAKLETTIDRYLSGILFIVRKGVNIKAELVLALASLGNEPQARTFTDKLWEDLIQSEEQNSFMVIRPR
jgi:hypothetical protein